MENILVTNDDGYRSAGFLPLVKELIKEHSVTAIAPLEQKSWIGKKITVKKTLNLEQIKFQGFEFFFLDGTPADCVQIGLYGLQKPTPAIVVSGINIGENVGHARILSSGTVGAAMEASIEGVKAICSSLFIPEKIKKKTDFFNPKNQEMFENAAKITAKITKIFLKNQFEKNTDIISINIPFDATVESEFEITMPFKKPYGSLFCRDGNNFFQKTPVLEFLNLKEGTDIKALNDGKISITPICLDLFNEKSFKKTRLLINKEW